MNWNTLALLIVEYGLPFAEKVWDFYQQKKEPTLDDFAQLRALANQNAAQRMATMIALHGQNLNEETKNILLQLAGGKTA